MADGDFLDLQNQLGAFMGAEDVGNLPLVEQQRVKKVINQAYRELYTPIDGQRPEWAIRTVGLEMPGQLEIGGSLTKGSTAFSYTGSALKADYEGSMCFVGGQSNRLTKVDATTNTGELLTPSPSTTSSLTVHVNSHRLPSDVVDVDGRPERVGWGVLSPMHGHDEEARYRSLLGYDFAPSTAFGHRTVSRINSNGDQYNFGDPMFFYVDSAALGHETVLSNRLVIYPLPSDPVTIRLRGNVMPTNLVADSDRAKLPADVVDDVLLPVARAKLAMIDRRREGD